MSLSVSNYLIDFDKVVEHFKQELKLIRSGRAMPTLVENIKVEAYGTLTPLIELASISAPEPKLIVIQPWDKSIIKEVERSLQSANLGASPVIDGAIIRLNFPPLNEERRREIVKLLNGKLEEAKVGVRNTREQVLKDFKAAKTEGTATEDDWFLAQKELQKTVDDYNDKLKNLSADKEKEVMTI
ncbi:ribosome recycling factor [Patescibacteria group bacterium]|nr:ribosome recycling factor [Patescibacteria group bacterium]